MKDLCIVLGVKYIGQMKQKFQNVEIYEDVNIQDSIKLAEELEAAGAKALIVTAGAYYQISEKLKIPVIPIYTTLFDLLHVIKSFENTMPQAHLNIACIFHKHRRLKIEGIQQYVRSKIHLYEYGNETDIQRLMPRLKQAGVDVVIGGTTSMHFAKMYGLQASMKCFGDETMSVAIDKGMSVLAAVKSATELNVRMKTIINLFSYGVIITDAQGVITECNPSGLEQLGLESRQIIGRKLNEVVKDDSWISSFADGKQKRDELKVHGEESFFVSDYPIILPDQRIVGSVATFQKAQAVEKLEQAYRRIKNSGLTAKYEFKNIIGKSKEILATIEQAKAYAKVDSTILIEGDTGSGKEIFAQSIHNASNRRYGPFVAINCAALPESLLESELMGYEEGAFTGAKKGGKPGLLELADKGTIFLDEINQITSSMQARLLRVIQEKQVLRLGGERMVPINTRIIAATNQALQPKVLLGEFREDLYYRLNVLNLAIPGVKARKDDIPLLLDFFIKELGKTYNFDQGLSKTSLALLSNYTWPGNVREIYNFAERYIVLVKDGSMTEKDFVEDFLAKNRSFELTDCEQGYLKVPFGTLAQIEQAVIKQALAATNGSKSCVAYMLGISRSSLWKKIKQMETVENS